MKKHLFSATMLASALLLLSGSACSSSDDPTPTPDPTDTTTPKPTPEPTDTLVPTPTPVTDSTAFIALNNDFILAVKNPTDTTIAKKARITLNTSIDNIKEIIPENIASRFAADTIWYSEDVIGVQYQPKASDSEFAGHFTIGKSYGPFRDSVKKNQPILLAHIYAQRIYDQELSDSEKASIQTTFNSSKSKYNKAYYSNGKKLIQNIVPTAKASEIEYFAELTECYLGTNNFYPFDIEELERHDAAGFNLMKSIWGEVSVPTNEYGITLPPTSLKQWLNYQQSTLDVYYRKYIDANGMPIVASRFVSDSALVQAKQIVIAMLEKSPEAQDEMLKCHFRIGIIGAYENVTDMPELRVMPIWWPGTDWDARGRGYGATEALPVMSCGEENIIKIPGYNERYPTESIMVHEFAHNVDFGIRKCNQEFADALDAAYAHAIETGLWDDTYSASNAAEYFAEGVQAWFDTCRMWVKIDGISTMLKYRTQLKDYDKMLYDVIASVMPERTLFGYHFQYE